MTPFSIIPLLIIFPIISFLIQKKHLLILLLSLEGVILSLVLILSIISFSLKTINLFTPIFLLAIGACEAALGLSLLVVITRFYGSDLINSLSINKC